MLMRIQRRALEAHVEAHRAARATLRLVFHALRAGEPVVPVVVGIDEGHAELLREARAAFDTVGGHLDQSRFKAGVTEAMRIVGAANRYIAATEPWKLAKEPEQRERLGTVLHTALQVVSDANTLLTPFMPSAAQQIHGALGGAGVWAAAPQIHEVVDDMPVDVAGVGVPPTGHQYPVIMGDYASEQARWARTDITPGTPLAKPTPLFAKVDPELAETGPAWAPIQQPAGGDGS